MRSFTVNHLGCLLFSCFVLAVAQEQLEAVIPEVSQPDDGDDLGTDSGNDVMVAMYRLHDQLERAFDSIEQQREEQQREEQLAQSQSETVAKRPRHTPTHAFVHIGKKSQLPWDNPFYKYPDTDFPEQPMDKRSFHTFVRFGRSGGDDDDFEKRGHHRFVRFGRSNPSTSNIFDQPSSFYDSDDGSDYDVNKRGWHKFVRFGRSAPFKKPNLQDLPSVEPEDSGSIFMTRLRKNYPSRQQKRYRNARVGRLPALLFLVQNPSRSESAAQPNSSSQGSYQHRNSVARYGRR